MKVYNKLFIISISIIIISMVFFFYLGFNAGETKPTPQEYNTRQDLQPSIYFKASNSPITKNTLKRTLIISFDREEFDYLQVSATGSMKPTIPDKGTIIVIKPEENEISVGDIISFNCNNEKIVHRIINYTDSIYITKGDNNEIDDFQAFGCKTKFEDIEYKIVGSLY